jgi:hypothetical protein
MGKIRKLRDDRKMLSIVESISGTKTIWTDRTINSLLERAI